MFLPVGNDDNKICDVTSVITGCFLKLGIPEMFGAPESPAHQGT